MPSASLTAPQSSSNPTASAQAAPSRAPLYLGRALSTLAILFLALDAVAKLLQLPEVMRGSAELGFAPGTIVPLGAVLLACVVFYAVPATSPLGAVLLTGYLGGAIATHVRMGNPLFTHTLFPTYLAPFVWGGLFLRDRRVRSFFSWSRQVSPSATK